MPYTSAEPEPTAISESMLGSRIKRRLKPLLKNFRLMKITGNASRNCVNALGSMYFMPLKNHGSGKCIISPIDRYIMGIMKHSDTISRVFMLLYSFFAGSSPGCCFVAAPGTDAP